MIVRTTDGQRRGHSFGMCCRRAARPLCFVFLAWLVLSQAVFATGSASVVGLHENGGNPTLFVRGLTGKIQGVDVLVGKTPCENVEYGPISDKKVPIKTLLLLDNSESIPEGMRVGFRTLISAIIRSGSEKNQYAYAKYGDDVVMDVGFTSDDGKIEAAVLNTPTVNRETYLTDELYAILSDENFFGKEDKSFDRIIVFSDGVDNNPIGITDAELSKMIEQRHIPIYTVGVYDANKANDASLEHMFSISRQSGAQSFFLDADPDVTKIIEALGQDDKIRYFTIKTNDSLKDGSTKTISMDIQTSDGKAKVSVDNVRMDQTAKKKKEAAPAPTPPPVPVAPTKPSMPGIRLFGWFIPLPLFLIALILILGGGGTAIWYFVYTKQKKDQEQNAIREVDIPDFGIDEDTGTVMDRPFSQPINDLSDVERTVSLFDEAGGGDRLIRLIDADNPAKVYKGYLAEGRSLTLGRSREVDITIEGDRTVSGRHCRFSQSGGRIFCEDLQSSNGTFIDGNRIYGSAEIRSDTMIKVGKTRLRANYV